MPNVAPNLPFAAEQTEKTGENAVKAFLAACIAIVAIGVGAAFVLDSSFQRNVDQAYVGPGARIDRH